MAARAFPKPGPEGGRGPLIGSGAGRRTPRSPRRDRADGLVARPSSSPDTTTGMRGFVRCRTEPGRLSHCSPGSRESFSGAADRLSACDRVGAVDIHRAAAADPLATRSSEHEGGIDPVLDEKKSIQDHGAAFVEIDVIGVDPGTLVPIGIEPIYLERFGAPCAFGRRPNLAYTNLGVSRQPNIPQKSSHVRALD